MCIDVLPVCDPKLVCYQVCPMMGRYLRASRRSAMKQKKRKFSYSKNKFFCDAQGTKKIVYNIFFFTWISIRAVSGK